MYIHISDAAILSKVLGNCSGRVLIFKAKRDKEITRSKLGLQEFSNQLHSQQASGSI